MEEREIPQGVVGTSGQWGVMGRVGGMAEAFAAGVEAVGR
jgi:hypothetical protein